MQNKKLLIIYHSQSGHTKALANAVRYGAQNDVSEPPAVDVRMLMAADAGLDDLLWCDAVNFGYMSGTLKDFFDRTYYPAEH